MRIRFPNICFIADETKNNGGEGGGGGSGGADPAAGGGGGGGGSGGAQAGGAKQQDKVDDKTKDKDGTAGAKKEPAAAGAKKEPKELKDDEEPGEDDEKIILSQRALKSRLDRFSKAQLKEVFGTSNIEEIKESIAAGSKALAKLEEDRKAKLTEEQRLKEENAKEKRRADEAEQRASQLEEERIVDREQTHLREIFSDHVKSKHLKHVMSDFRDHLVETYSPKEMDALTDKDIQKWIAKYVEENPEFSKADAKDDKAPRKEGLTTGPGGKNNPPKPKESGSTSEKTARPGQPNSMSRSEVKAQLASKGITSY